MTKFHALAERSRTEPGDNESQRTYAHASHRQKLCSVMILSGSRVVKLPSSTIMLPASLTVGGRTRGLQRGPSECCGGDEARHRSKEGHEKEREDLHLLATRCGNKSKCNTLLRSQSVTESTQPGYES